jgi:hypothetical protein
LLVRDAGSFNLVIEVGVVLGDKGLVDGVVLDAIFTHSVANTQGLGVWDMFG